MLALSTNTVSLTLPAKVLAFLIATPPFVIAARSDDLATPSSSDCADHGENPEHDRDPQRR